MKNKLLIFLARLNFIYPNYLGLAYIKYRFFFKRNRKEFNQFPLLKSIVNESKQSVPHYTDSIVEKINDIQSFEKNIPFIDKDVVMNDWDSFIQKNIPAKKYSIGTTGGTSGKPMKLLMPKNRYIVEFNTIFSIWKQFGWNGHIRAVIRNKHLKNNEDFQVHPITKEIIFDGFRTDDEYYEIIYEKIKKLNIKYIHAYPSSAYQFSLFLLKKKKDTSFLNAFLCGSEGVTALQRQLITEQLGIPICEFYGHSEKLILGGPCKGNDAIHIEPTYGYFELINEKNEVIKTKGEVGEMVGTTFHNSYMPLIRYKTGDFAQYAGNYCPSCQRHLTLINNIQGRRDSNKVYLKDNTYISITALNLHSDLYLYINGMQYIQRKKGYLEILIIKGNKFTKDIEDRFKVHFDSSFLGKCNYQIIYIDKVIKEPNGKFLPLKQLITA